MTQDDIIRFAIQCRLVTTGNRDGIYMDALTKFAKLAAAKAFQDGYEKGIAAFNEAVSLEREACAKVVDARLEKWEKNIGKDKMYKWMRGLPEVIRARGEQA
jgi:hypothetical protein